MMPRVIKAKRCFTWLFSYRTLALFHPSRKYLEPGMPSIEEPLGQHWALMLDEVAGMFGRGFCDLRKAATVA